jgi:hypothetical protein
LALVVLASVVAYAVTPVSGDPLFFAFNLRYTIPAQGIAALVVATRWVSAWAQRMLTLIFGAGVLLAWPGASSGVLRAAAWPSGSGHRVAAVAFVVAVVLVAACVLALPRVGQAVVVLGAVAGLVVASRGVWDRYGPARYAHLSGGLGPAWAWAQTVRDARIGVVGVYQQYPFYGPDLTNSVVDIGVPTPHGGWARAEDCATWRTLVDAGRYRYVVTGRDEIAPPPGPPPERAWTLTSGAARVVLETGTTDVFAIEGPLDPATCPAGSPGGPGPAGVP